MTAHARRPDPRGSRPSIPSLAQIFWSPLANGFRRMAEWRRRGVLGEALQAHRRRAAMRFDTLEPRILLSADLTHAAAEGVALDATLRVDDAGGAPILRLIDNPSSTILGEHLIDQDINFTVLGNDQSDRLKIGFDRASLAHQVRVNFHGGEGGADELIGADSDSTWILDGPGSGSSDDATFTGVERVEGGAGDDTFVVLDASITTEVAGGAGDDTLVGADADNTWVITGEDAGALNGQGFVEIENLTGGAANDTFIFAGGSISGTIDGGGGVNTFDYGSRTASVTVDLEAGAATDVAAMVNVTRVVGGQGNDTLIGRSEDNTWTVSGRNAGGVGSVEFAEIENVTGGAGSDSFVFAQDARLDGLISGGLG
ncbi:MAG: LEPR-XLL domain-containing protein, partial [Gammaproteobacteria bacterium]